MIEIKGKVNTAICYATVVEGEAIEQIRRMCDHDFTAGSQIRIMPDVHAGKGCTIGTTMTITDKAVPNIVGVDIGCGMYTAELGKVDVDFEKVDAAAHDIPSGRDVWEGRMERFDLAGLRCYRNLKQAKRLERSLGTLGGGNHFIEIDAASDGTKYLVIHSGSRNLGKQVAEIYQSLAIDLNAGKADYFERRDELIRTYKEQGRRAEIQTALKAMEKEWAAKEPTIPADLCYLYGTYLEDYAEDAAIAMKILFFGRDVRGGLGERRVFRVIINWLAENRAESLRKNIELIPEFGRYDDLVSLIGTACEKDALRTIRKQLEADLASDAEVSLLAKWLPSVNASNAETVRKAKRIARYLGMSDAEYRKTLVGLRRKIRIIENHLRKKDYSFDYAKQPSKAMFKYRKAFLRNDGERYHAFLEAVSSGEKQLHADNLAPYEIVRSALNANRWGFHADLTVGEKAALNASWASLPDFCDNRNALAVVDTSGSMYCYDNALPAAVALSLGLYFGERNTGIFHNHFIEFSSRPQLIEIKGKTFAERLEYLCTFNEVADTNVEAVFDLILDAAVRNNVPQGELPETLYLISDMEFNACVRNASVSNFASAKRRFAEHGYRLPQIVFWNVASRNSNQPVTRNEQGVALVSGCTPRLFSMVASGDLSPYSVMMDIIESERYAKISV